MQLGSSLAYGGAKLPGWVIPVADQPIVVAFGGDTAVRVATERRGRLRGIVPDDGEPVQQPVRIVITARRSAGELLGEQPPVWIEGVDGLAGPRVLQAGQPPIQVVGVRDLQAGRAYRVVPVASVMLVRWPAA